MDRDAVLEQVRQVLDDELGVEPDRVTPAADLRDDLELDSLDLVELVAVLEDRTGSTIQGDGFDEVRTVADVVDAILAAMEGGTVEGGAVEGGAVQPTAAP